MTSCVGDSIWWVEHFCRASDLLIHRRIVLLHSDAYVFVRSYGEHIECDIYAFLNSQTRDAASLLSCREYFTIFLSWYESYGFDDETLLACSLKSPCDEGLILTYVQPLLLPRGRSADDATTSVDMEDEGDTPGGNPYDDFILPVYIEETTRRMASDKRYNYNIQNERQRCNLFIDDECDSS
ncbi:hypothetical protein L7F22_006054 [Adiantum nelumboides]|nr:hypothetical protein [Adiantum nelumboides]